MEEEDNNFNDANLDNPLFNKQLEQKNKTLKLIIIFVILNILLIGLVTFGIINLYDKDDNNKNKDKNKEENENDLLTVLKYDKDFIKPNVKLNLEFELVKLKK